MKERSDSPAKSTAEQRRSRPSAHDVARLAGVSQAAVSRAFTPGASIAEATRQKVLKAAQELGYRPNLLARSLITGRSGLVGVIIGSPRNPFYLEALGFLSEVLSKAGRQLQVFTTRPESSADQFVEELLKFQVEALLLMSANVSLELAHQCREEGIRVIYFSRRAKTMSGFASVTGANQEGARRIARHLIAQGYKRPAYIGGIEGSSTSEERGAAFIAEIDAAGLPTPIVEHGDYDRLATMDAARRLLSRDPRPDAIFCANDMTALAAIETARFEFKLEIGRDVGFVGFDDIEGASWLSYDLTTYSQPTEEMVREAAQMILADKATDDAPHIIVEGELRLRGSTRRN